MSVNEVHSKISLTVLTYLAKPSTSTQSLLNTDLPLNMPLPLLMAIAAGVTFTNRHFCLQCYLLRVPEFEVSIQLMKR